MKTFKPAPLFLGVAISAGVCWASSAPAQVVAYDDASEYVVTTNWTNGANQGFGFTPWVILTNASGPGGFEGWYINPAAGSSYANAIITNVAGTNYSCVWGLYANGTNEINQTTAFRGFSNTLGTNTFKIQWGAREAGSTTVTGLGAVNGWCGFTLCQGNAASTPSDFETGERFGLYFQNGLAPSTLYIWDNSGYQTSVPGTSFSNLGRDSITNAVQAEITPAADGMSYHLVLKDVVKGQTFYTYNGVFNGGVGTEDSVALFDYETQSPGDQVYNRMQIATPQIPPEINNVQPANGSIFLPTSTQLSFEVDSFDDTVSSNAVTVYLNGVLQTGTTYNTSGATNQLLGVNNPALATDTFYNYTIVAQDAAGNSTTNRFTFNTFSSTNTSIQAEDYNFGAGQYFPSPTPLEYANLPGSNGIDYLDLDSVSNNPYRPSATPLPQLLPATDTVDHDLYFENGVSDYQLANPDAGSWDNYTRSFLGTPFTLYARAASGGGGLFQVNLLANTSATTTNQPLAALGTCSVPNTGGLTVYNGPLVPLTDLFGNTVVLNLSGTKTLQHAAISSQNYDLYYLMLVPNSSTNLLTPYVSVGSPTPGATSVGLSSPISFTIANRQTLVATNTIQLFVNSTNVTSKLKLTSNSVGTAASYPLTTNMPANSTNIVTVVFNDTTGTNATTNSWSFVTAANGGVIGSGVWSGGGGFIQTWETAANWTGGTPGPGFSASFASAGATSTLVTNNIVDTNTTIQQLNYETNNSGYHTTYIANGVTLTVTNGSTTTGTEALQVGGVGNGGDNVFNQKVTNTITGIGGTLMVLGNPEGSGRVNSLNLQVRQSATTGAPEQNVMDMSGLGTLIATVGKLTVGQGGAGVGQSNVSGRLNLAMTNTITLLRTGTSGLLVVGDSSGGAFTLAASTLNLGITNALFLDSMNIGNRRATNALFRFNPIFTNFNPAVYIRDTNGPASGLTTWNIGNVNGDATATTISNSGTVDFSGGTVDALVGTMTVGAGSTSASDTGFAQGTLTWTAGTMVVTNLNVGVQHAVNAAAVTGTINVNGTATLVSTNIFMAQAASGAATPPSGTLNIAGTVQGNITGGGGTSTVNLNGGALIVPASDTVGTASAPLTAVNFAGGTLHLNINGNASTAIVFATNVTASSAAIVVDSVTNVTGTNTIHLISYTGTDPYAGFALALPYGYAGSLVDNAGNIDLTVMTAPLPPSPTISSVVIRGSQVILGGSNNVDVAGGGYSVLTSTNLALPLTNWTLLNRGTFNSNGNFSSTNALSTNAAQYFILRLP